MSDEAFERRLKQARAAFKAAAPDVEDVVIEKAASDPNLQLYVHDPEYMKGILVRMAVEHS